MVNFSDYRSILCLNGRLPSCNFFNQNLPIIAADGAANTLMQMGIKPQLVIGDMDSIESEYAAELPLLFHEDQDYCDYQKTLFYLREKDLLPAIVVGINGGCLDHILNNINLFMQSESILFSPPIYGLVLRTGTVKTFHLTPNTKLSLFGLPSAIVTSIGLQWELNHFAMSFPGKNSCFNRVVDSSVQLHVEKGQVLVLIYYDLSPDEID